MSVRYVNFTHYKRGVPNTNPNSKAKYRTCMHCGSRAHWTATRRSGNFVIDVRYCDKDKATAEAINGSRS